MQTTLRIEQDGWRTEISELEDRSLLVLVNAPSGRSWRTERATIEEALSVARAIVLEQSAEASGA